MSADKRSVATDALEVLGTIIDEGIGRDAIHLAVEPVVAGQMLMPGQDIGLVNREAFASVNPSDFLGIVDPFIKGPIQKGQRFLMVIYPRKITSLRHVWTHPALDNVEEMVNTPPISSSKSDSEAWLRKFCDSADCPGYEAVMAAIDSSDNDGEWVMFYDRNAHGDIPAEFWTHAEIVLGKKLRHADGFSCSC